MTETSATRRLGQVISERYRILELLGEGGMGAVYLAEHTLMRKRVALKLLHPEMSGNEEVLARFRREAEAAAHIEHPNVAAATDFGQTDDGAFFLVLEYVEGTSLRDALAKGPFAAERALHVARQIALALERAHAAGIVHRDLKPENVMLVKRGDDEDFVKVLDFGIAKIEPKTEREASAQPLTRLGTVLGTPEYMAPEQAVGDVAGPAADLYSMGVMLYEMLSGVHPFEATDSMQVLSMHVIAPVPSMNERAPGVTVDPSAEAIARRLLEKEPQNRYANARALVDAIDAVAATPSSFVRSSAPDVLPPVDAFAKTHVGLVAEPPATATTSTKPPALSKNALLAIAIAGPLALVTLVVVVLASRAATSDAARTDAASAAGEVAKTKPKAASKNELENATRSGLDALDALAEQYPSDPQVLRALALARNEAGRAGDALKAVRALAALGDGGLAAVDGDVLGIVVGAAGLPTHADEAFALLEGPLGARGVDALIDLAQVKSSPQLRARATRSLAKSDVRAKASPAAAIVLDLKAAKTCAAKHELLDRAKTDGDARLLGVLVPMKETRGCGFMGMRDCWPCLRKDSSLDDAVAAIEARAAK